MKRVLSLILSLVMLVSITAGIDFSAYAASNTVSLTTNVVEKYDYANEVFAKINNERSKKGKSKLKIDSTLTSYAMQRAAEIAYNYSHTRPNGSKYSTIGKKANGENLHAGPKTPTAVMKDWMNSKAHRENILNGNFKSVGVGVAEVNGYYFWVQIFSRSSGNSKKSTGSKYVNRSVSVLKKDLFFYINSYDLATDYNMQYSYINAGFCSGDEYYFDTTGIDYEMVPNGYQVKVNAISLKNSSFVGYTNAIVDKSMFTYSSSNNSIFTVSSTGAINIKKSGTATLTVTFKKDKKYKIKEKITVRRNSTIKISKSSFTYDGKIHKPTVSIYDKNNIKQTNYRCEYLTNCKNVGTHTIKISYEKFDYPIKYTFKILPKSTSVSSLSAGSKKFTVKWKKQSTQTTGYQIQYSTSSKFTNAKTVTVGKNSTTSKSITKLSGKKKYYVRVRTYKKVGSTNYYSSWSKAKYVTTKK